MRERYWATVHSFGGRGKALCFQKSVLNRCSAFDLEVLVVWHSVAQQKQSMLKKETNSPQAPKFTPVIVRCQGYALASIPTC
jgi:hypothetical protein